MARRLSELRKSVDYLAQSAVSDFMDEVHDLMADGRITQGQLAARTGWKPSYVSRILRGQTNLTLKTMARLAAGLNKFVRVHLAREGVLVQWVEKAPEEITADTGPADFPYRSSDLARLRVSHISDATQH